MTNASATVSVNHFASWLQLEWREVNPFATFLREFYKPFLFLIEDVVLQPNPHRLGIRHRNQPNTDEIQPLVDNLLEFRRVFHPRNDVSVSTRIIPKDREFLRRFEMQRSNPGFAHELNCMDPRSSA